MASSASSDLKLWCIFGGETRMLVLPRSLSFSELREKIAAVYDGDVVIKYQLTPDDLEALVTVRSDEDVRQMVDAYDCLEAASSPTASARFRVLLFPCTDSPELPNLDTVMAEPAGIVHNAHGSTNLQKLPERSQRRPPHRLIRGRNGGPLFTCLCRTNEFYSGRRTADK